LSSEEGVLHEAILQPQIDSHAFRTHRLLVRQCNLPNQDPKVLNKGSEESQRTVRHRKGTVNDVHVSKTGTVFFNMDGKYPNHLFTGIIKICQGKPEIILNSPKQIRIVQQE
jgi:hypothetical protein